jgi:hypothetical protein
VTLVECQSVVHKTIHTQTKTSTGHVTHMHVKREFIIATSFVEAFRLLFLIHHQKLALIT